jgi:hypothetical protein
MNLLALILQFAIPLGEQIAVHFIHSKDGQHTLTTVTGDVNTIVPIVEGVVAGLQQKKDAGNSAN